MQTQFVGIDWATRRARWCAVTPAGAVIDEGWTPADEDGLAILVGHLGPDARACLEMMSGRLGPRPADGRWLDGADRRRTQGEGGRVAGCEDRQGSTRGSWPSWPAVTLSHRYTCRRSPTESSRSASGAGCTWFG